MANYMDSLQLEGFLIHILSPMYRITEDDTIQDQGMGKQRQRSYLQIVSFMFFS